MNNIKRILGIAWMLLAAAYIIVLAISAYQNIGGEGKGDISRPLLWVIIIYIFTPIAIGMALFGWYAWKGEYDSEMRNIEQRTRNAK